MGDTIYQNPQLTKKYHHKMLSSLLGRYGLWPSHIHSDLVILQ